MRTSYSALETYLQCPQRYKFQEIDRIKVPKSKEAIFGTLIHGALNFMFKRDPLYPTLDEVIAHFRERWPKQNIIEKEVLDDPLRRGWTEEEERLYFEEGVRMLRWFYEKNAPWKYSILDLESRFAVTLPDEHTGRTHILTGIIDRIDKLGDHAYEIIDYKTSRKMPSQEALDNNLQLSLYSLGIQKRWPHIRAEEIVLSLYFLKHGEKLSTRASDATTDATKKHILTTIEEIENRIEQKKGFEPSPGPLCDWCGFRPLCPAWKHLYRNKKTPEEVPDIKPVINEFFSLRREIKQREERIATLQGTIKSFMVEQKLTRLFSDQGIVSQKLQRRFEYDLAKIKEILSPLGKWEEVLKADDTKLKKILTEIPQSARDQIARARVLKKEFTILTASESRASFGVPDEAGDESPAAKN